MTANNFQGRVLYIDTIRAAMMSLGVFYHAAVIYGGSTWYVSSEDSSLFLRIFYEFTQTFRMPAFFIVSGFFAGLLLTRETRKTHLTSRLEKLGIPLIFVGLTLNFSIYFLATNREIPENMATYILGGYWLGHLWFLGSLITYTLVLTAIYPLASSLAKHFDKHPFVSTALMFIGWSVFIQILRMPSDLHEIRWIFVSVGITLQYWPLFLFGFYLFFSQSLQRSFLSLKNSLVILAAFVVSFYFLKDTWIRDEVGLWIAIKYLCFYAMSGLVFWLAKKLFDKPSTLVRKVADASYSIYLLHLPLLIIGFHIIPDSISPFLSFLINSTITFAVSYAIHEIIIKKSLLLLYLLNGKNTSTSKLKAS